MHLVQMYDPALGIIEESCADGGEGDGRVGELPLAVGGGVDFGPERTTEDLVAEADAAEADVGALLPES